MAANLAGWTPMECDGKHMPDSRRTQLCALALALKVDACFLALTAASGRYGEGVRAPALST
jgi:hypothetical protein